MEAATARRPTPPPDAPTEEAIIAALVVILLSGLPPAVAANYAISLLTPLGISAEAVRAAVALVLPQVGDVTPGPPESAEGFVIHTQTPRQAAYLLNAARRLDAIDPRTVAEAEQRRHDAERDLSAARAAARAAEGYDQERIAKAAVGQAEEALRRAERAVREASDPELAREAAERRERQYLAQHVAAERARRDAAKDADRAARIHGPVLGWHAVRDSRTTAECEAAHGSNFHVSQPPAIGLPGSLHGGTCRCRAGAPFPDGRDANEAVGGAREDER